MGIAANLSIRQMVLEDIPKVAKVHNEAFPRQTFSRQWISCNFQAFPRIRYFVAEIDHDIVGYVQWTEKSGFRAEVVLELEQIAVISAMQNKKIGTSLILQSLPLVKSELQQRGAKIRSILVTTRSDNHAQKLYSNILGAKVVATICNLFSADEVLMLARNTDTD